MNLLDSFIPYRTTESLALNSIFNTRMLSYNIDTLIATASCNRDILKPFCP